MSWKDGLNAALLKFLKEEMGKTDATEIVDFRPDRQERGYCDTCAYSVTVVEISYRTGGNQRTKTVEWEGEFSDLISRLGE